MKHLNCFRVLLLSIDANLDFKLYQLDVRNVFLNDELEDEVYITIPLGLEKSIKKIIIEKHV